MGRFSYRVIGVRPDGREGIVLFSNNRQRAEVLAGFVIHLNRDWDVRIEMTPADPQEKPIVISRTQRKAEDAV